MLENRLGEWFAESAVTAGVASAAEAFVPCPCCVLTGFNPAHMAFVEEVYRRAREMTEAQFSKPARTRVPEFSLN